MELVFDTYIESLMGEVESARKKFSCMPTNLNAMWRNSASSRAGIP